MKNVICLFEDEEYINLLPLVYLRPVFDLRCGALTLKQKISLRFPKAEYIFHCRSYLQDALRERNPKHHINQFDADSILFLNGRILMNEKLVKTISKFKEDFILRNGSSVVATKLCGNNIKKILSANSEFLQFNNLTNIINEDIDNELITYPWQLVNNNGEQIKSDYGLLTKKRKTSAFKFKSVEIINKKNVFIDKGTIINPFVVLDASEGPIYISNNVKIMPHSFIQGPVFIGEGSVIKAHAAIYHNTSIGEVCKIGGEVEASIIHSYSNKQHEGFLGHSYLGSWVNIGASTNNSDLKNNYSNIEVLVNGKKVNTNSTFVGLIMGDHSKTAINTMFNTGTVVGVSCNIFGAGFPAKYIPSFTWGGCEFMRTYTTSKSLEVAKLVMQRRKIELTQTEASLIRNVFDMTQNERIFRK